MLMLSEQFESMLLRYFIHLSVVDVNVGVSYKETSLITCVNTHFYSHRTIKFSGPNPY